MANKSDLIVVASAKAKPTRARPGCVAFSLYRAAENTSIFIGYERWGSKQDHAKHLEGANVQKLMTAMADILAEPPLISSYDILGENT